jgi:glycerate dehydrogenase
MKTVIIDGYTTNPGDLSWEGFSQFGTYQVYDRTEDTEKDRLILERIGDADAIVVNGNQITGDMMRQCPNLKFISECATGYDNIDIHTARELGIAVTNVPGYSTDAVAQHTIALLLELTNHVALHNSAVQKGEWFDSPDFCFTKKPLTLLAGKTLGIVGFGAIGKRVAEIAGALGMRIIKYREDPEKALAADVVTLHCPLNEETRHFINRESISRMKDGALLINTGRGGLLDEDAVAEALKAGKLAGLAADVLSTEPPARDNPLIGLDNAIITPHIAWIPKETREYLIQVCLDNQKSFLDGGTLNRIV